MNANKPVIGITGGLATGKSTVAEILKKEFKYYISADEVAGNIVKKGKPALKKLVKVFGRTVLAKGGSLDRKQLAGIIFNNYKKRKLLEKILHPLVIAEIKRYITQFKIKNRIIIFEAPLLFEARMEKMADIIVVVASSKKKQVQRFIKTGHSRKDSLLRIKAQLPLKEKIKKADIVLYNNGSLKELKKNVKSLAKIIKEL